MATKPKVGQIKSSQPRFELLDASPDQFEAIRFYDDAPAAPAPEEEGRTIGGTIKDVGISALKGAIAVPEAAVGLADLVTGGYAGKLLENEGGAVGFRPKQAKAALEEGYSPAQKAAFQRVQAAEGLGDTFMAAVQNPSVIGHSVVESLPLMGAGGVVARGGLALAPRLAAAPGAGIVAGAVGEGAVGAGSAAESIRQQSADGLLTGGQAGLAAASGGATALFGYLGGKVAQKLGIADVDTMLAGAATDPALRKGVVRSALEGAFAEGVLEELPQSISEQVLQNIALDRPLDEGVNQAAVLGLLSGGLMGGGANVVNSLTAPAPSGLPEPAVKPTAAGQAPAAPPAAPTPSGPLSRAASKAQPMAAEGLPLGASLTGQTGASLLQPQENELMTAIRQNEEDAAAQKVIDARRAAEQAQAPAADAGIPASTAQPEPAAQPAPAGRFTSAQEAQDYISTQRRAASASLPRALPIQNEDGSFGVAVDGTPAFAVATEQDRVRRLEAAGVLPDDVLNPKGEPFKTKASATTAAKKQGGQVVPVTGGFVVRKQQAVTDGAGAGVAPSGAASDGAGRPDAAPGVGSGVPAAGRVGADTRRAKAGGVGQSFELPFGAADDAVTQPAATSQPQRPPIKKGTETAGTPAADARWRTTYDYGSQPGKVLGYVESEEGNLVRFQADSGEVMDIPPLALMPAEPAAKNHPKPASNEQAPAETAATDATEEGLPGAGATGQPVEAAGVEGTPKRKTKGSEAVSPALREAMERMGLDPDAPADKARELRKKADALQNEARKMVEGIPPGQPVMTVTDKNRRERAAEKSRKAADLFAQADKLDAEKAANPAGTQPAAEPPKRVDSTAPEHQAVGDKQRRSVQSARGFTVGDKVRVLPKESADPRRSGETGYDSATITEIEDNAPPAYNGTAVKVAIPDAKPDGRGTLWVAYDRLEKIEVQDDADSKAKSESAEPFTHSGLKVYPTRVKQQDGSIKQQWAVQTAENAAREQRGERQIGGDELVDTREQAIQRAEEMAARAERDAKSLAELEAQERAQADKAAADKAEAEDIDGFMPNATKLVRGRIVKTLSTPIMQGGKQTTRKALVRERVAAGAKVEQAKEGRRLVMPSGAYLGEDQISKTAMDYAEHLIAQRGEAPAAKAEPRQQALDYIKWWRSNNPGKGPDDLMAGIYQGASFQVGESGAPFTKAGQIMVDGVGATDRAARTFKIKDLWGEIDPAGPGGAQATHQDPGEKPEAATKAVVAESLQKAAKNEGEKPQQATKPSADTGGYSLPQGKISDDWRRYQADDFEPTDRQKMVMDATEMAMSEGFFYNDAIQDRVAQILNVPPDVLAKNETGVQGGDFGYDVYYAQLAVRSRKERAAMLEAFKALNPKDGDKIGVIVTSDGKMTNAVTVTKAGENGYGMVLEGRRGPAGVRFTNMTAVGLKEAVNRAKEKGKRKEGFDEFVKSRQGGEAQPSGTNDRDSFTLQRLNPDTNQMEPVTFKRGDYVRVNLTSGQDASGEIDGISQARREFSVDGLWHPFGFAYKTERPAQDQPPTVPLSSVIAKMNAKNGEGLTDADRVPGSADIGWDTMSPEQRTQILSAPGGWSTAKGGLNAVGKGLAKRAWADIVPATRATIEGLVAKVGSGTSQPASKTPTVDAHEKVMEAVREGTATPEQFKASFESVVANKEAIVAELGTKTKAELLRDGGYFLRMRYANESKPEIVDAFYRYLVGEYVLGETLSYGMGKGAYEAAVRRHVEATDADKLAQYAKDRAAAVAEAQAKADARAEALKNPQTLDDYRNLLNAHIMTGKTRKEAFLMLTPEQRVQYDELEAESTREARERRKRELKTQVRAAGQTTGGEIIATKHTRDGYDLFVVQLADRVSKEDYKTLLSSAKRMGGWYSSFRGNGAVPGFQFKDRAQAEAFKALAGGDTAAAEEQVAARRDAFEDDRSQSAVERLTAMADKLDEQAQQAMNVERKTNTARRARFASAAEDAARQQQALAKTMRNIAQAIEGGRAKFLDSVRTKTQVEMLAGAVRTAKDNELRAKYDSYGEQQKRKGQPPTAETADYAEFPSFTAFRSDLASLARQMLEVEGTKKMGAQLMKVADDVTDAYMEFAKANQLQVSQFGNKAGGLAVFASREDAERAIKRSGLVGKAIVLPVKRGENRVILSPSEAMSRGIWTGDGDKRITLTREFGQELVDAIGRRGNKTNGLSVPWQFESASDRLKAMARIGIETPAEFRSALREFIGLQEQAKEADRVKMLERDMVGRKNDGLDFFPTPQTVADQMVEAAGIEPDMAVLEPSAGMGHIADRIREAGAEPDVIEMANDRAELLEAKGFNVLARDFMEIKPRESYTFGDVFKTADGIEGIMRGAGGMGSNRVRLVNEAGDMLGYYDRDELTGVRLRGTESGYDRIIMNPPFSDRRDAEHVRHAFELLRPGGRLVAIMGEGVFFGKDKKAQDFRDWLEEQGGTSEKLPEGSFMDPTLPVNTAVNARMVVIDKPGAKAAKADDAPMFSRSAADPAESLADTMLELGQVQELFQLPKSDAKDLVQVAAAKNVKAAPVTKKQMLDNRAVAAQTLGMNMSDKPGAKFWLLRTAEGKLGMLTEIDGEVYIDVSVGGTGLGGSAIYDTAMNYTANNPGKVFIGDPNDLSKAAMSRRLENMLSAAVKYGGTDFMRPHQYQTEGRYGFAPLDWTEGDSRANIEAMVKASVAATGKTNPVATSNVEFDPATQSFRDWQDQPLDAASLSEMLGFDGREPGSGSAGRTTLQRNALYRALLSGPGARRALLESVRGQQTGGRPGIGGALERAFYSRGSVATASLSRESTQQIADAISARWANAPEIIVARDMSDYVIPQRVRDSNDAAKSAGASGEPEGFIYQGKVYLVSDQLRSSQDVARVLFHEALGHAGLRGVFGDELKPILRQIALVRAKDVRAKAKEYGLDMAKEADRLQAAEEVLANMAQTAPELGFVKRAIAAIRTWLRNNVALFRDIDVTDDEIIRDYILPARGFIERGREAAAPKALPAFSRKIPELGIVDEATEALVQEYGEPVASIMDAERRHAAGERIFAMHEQSESLSEITSVRQIKNWAPDQLVAVHRGVFEDGAAYSRANQTNTPEFRRWFGDSKVVDDQGKPLVVYHGGSSIDVFDASKTADGVFYFTEDKAGAREYAELRGKSGITAVYLRIENDGSARFKEMQRDKATWKGYRDAYDRLKAEGFDGVISEGDEIIVFRPEQIKSATGNAGTFDPANPDIRYSRAAVSNLANRATDLLNDALSHPGKLSFWDKSVGSMYHIAQRYPAFRRVFNSAQNFINDVSYYATEAAEQAPKILPRLETWRDLAKSPIKAADNNAIARPILEGTLSWTRDEDGSPVRVDDIEAAGIVWRDGELRSMFNLTDDQIALYREFRAATDLSLDNMGKADLLRYAGKDLEDLRDMVMDAPDVMAAAKVMRGQLQELADADPERSKELIAMAGDLEKRAERVQNLKRDGYAPLSRFGRYTVDVVVDGERRYFSLFDTARDANKMAAKMRAEFGADAVSQGTLSQREFEAFQGITPESLELFGNMLGLDSTGDEAQDKVFQTYLRLTKANRSALKRLIHRKGVAGYSDDMGRVLAAFVYSNARQTSAALHMGEMGRAVQDIPKGQGELKDVAIELSSYIKQPREEAQALRGLLFAQYLGGSVASAFVNFTQPFTVTFPYLIRFGGARRSAQALMKAMADQRDGVKLEDGLARALKTAEEQGVVAPQEVHQLMAQARGESTLKAGDGTRAGEALAATRNAWTRTALAWGKLFGMAEQINRRSTFIAAYRIAAERGMRNPSAFATKAVNETQFVNNRANKARWARGPVGATLMTFKSYSVHYMELMHRLATREGPEGKKAAAMMLGMLLLVAGAGGLPFVEDAEDVVDMIAQRMGYNFSSKQAKRKFLEDLFGQAGAEFVEKGITGIAGSPIDISGRMSMANLIPGTGLLLKKPDQSRDMQELVGPVGDLVKRGWKGADLALSGEFGKALLEVSPRAVANAAKGVDMATTGVYTDTRGRKVIETDLTDAAAKAIGFQPQSVARVQDATFTVQKMVSQNKMREAEIAEKWAQGIYEGNKAKIEEAREALRDWNRKNPKTPIRIELPQILKRVRAMRMSKEDRIAKTAPSEIRGAVQRELAAQ